MTIAEILDSATQDLSKAGITSARLDSLILLADITNQDKSWVLAHMDSKLPASKVTKLKSQIAARVRRLPLAYIRGQTEFYGRKFTVSNQVMVPRPATETLVDQIKTIALSGGRLLDVGTGSGIIAITAALERPDLKVEASDISRTALLVAKQNAVYLGVNVDFFESDLLKRATGLYDIIVANLPYVARGWRFRSPETNFEPPLALFATDGGLAVIKELISKTPEYLRSGGYLILEADPRQHKIIQKAADEHGLVFVAADGFGLWFRAN